MKIDLTRLCRQLSEKEASQVTYTEITPYVQEHIYAPLTRGETLFLTALDFSKFGHEDINALEERLEEYQRVEYRLSNVSKTFRDAKPVSISKRVFC